MSSYQWCRGHLDSKSVHQARTKCRENGKRENKVADSENTPRAQARRTNQFEPDHARAVKDNCSELNGTKCGVLNGIVTMQRWVLQEIDETKQMSVPSDGCRGGSTSRRSAWVSVKKNHATWPREWRLVLPVTPRNQKGSQQKQNYQTCKTQEL